MCCSYNMLATINDIINLLCSVDDTFLNTNEKLTFNHMFADWNQFPLLSSLLNNKFINFDITQMWTKYFPLYMTLVEKHRKLMFCYLSYLPFIIIFVGHLPKCFVEKKTKYLKANFIIIKIINLMRQLTVATPD